MRDRSGQAGLTQALIELDMRIHSKLSFDEIMQSALDGFVAALGADAGDIKLLDRDDWIVRYQCGFGAAVVGERLSSHDARLAARVMQLREPVTIEDFSTEPPESYVGFSRTHGLRAVMAVPLFVQERVGGCLCAWMRDVPRSFLSDEIEFGRRVAASVALALENARLLTSEQIARRRAEAVEQDLQQELARTRVLLRASDELLSARDPDELLRRLASIVLDATGLTRVFINLIDARERVLIPKIATGGPITPTGCTIPFEELSETARKAIAGGRPAVLDYERADTPAKDRAIAEANQARVVLFVPLVHRGVVVGHISVDEPGQRCEFSSEQIRIVGSIATQAAVALQNAREASEHGVEVLEQQLRAMAFGLHDGPVQTLSAAAAMLERMGRSQEVDALHAQAAAAGGLLDYALSDMREIMRELRPAELDEASLVASISQYAEAHEARWGLPVRLRVTGREAAVRHAVRVSLFRVVQEALWNVRKHANAQSAEIHIHFGQAVVECTVEDDGDGFDVETALTPGATSGWGLVGMKERTLMIGGVLTIESVIGEGTLIRVCAPLGVAGEGDGCAR